MRSEWAPWPASSSFRFLLCGSESELGAIEGRKRKGDSKMWPRAGMQKQKAD